ncbi:alkaline phosphatase family protein [Cytobacillus solani]|uniref:alkaline phosphatase family protein n=1 Tax=Cytobacillus solani TaxID=1637975 RepID=UPI001154A8FF|nr:alkaline phosphatase family protein [Cytobacillus solani]USK55008.1 alkaline phosphatase family protein [Cytobacillus solani]
MRKPLFAVIIILNLFLFTTINRVGAAENQETNRKVILISFDGMKNDYTKKYVKENKLPHIKQLLDNGVSAKKPSTITPSLTAPSHAAIATGAAPNQTGIVSNHWHEPNKTLGNDDSGFQEEIQVPPLWVEARKQGKTTATIAFPGANPKDGKQGDYSIYFEKTWSPSNLESLTFTKAAEWVHPPKSFTPLQEAELTIKIENERDQLIHILAIDSTDDQQPNYDTFILSQDKKIDPNDSIVKGKQWGSLSLQINDRQKAGFWFKMKADNQDHTLPISLYRTEVTSSLISGPEGFADEIQEEFGFYPAQDDGTALKKGWITRKEYEEISTRFVMWVTKVALYIKQKYNPDLLMFYTPQIDHEQHKYLLIDPRQPGYSPEKSKQYMSYIEWSYRLADKVVGETLKSLNDNDYLFVVSDHGMEPAHSTLSPNKVLKDAGLLTVDQKNKINFTESKAYAIPSGSAAHVYINLQNREKDGIVPIEEYESVRSQIIQAFKEVEIKYKKGEVIQYDMKAIMSAIKTDNFSFNKVQEHVKDFWKHLFKQKIHPYEKVMKNTNTNKTLLDHQNSGDVVLIGAPGYVMGSGFVKNVSPPIELGTHGGDADRNMLRPVFMAIGTDFYKGKQINSMSNLDITPTIYDLLELNVPSFVEGKKIKGIYKDKNGYKPSQ